MKTSDSRIKEQHHLISPRHAHEKMSRPLRRRDGVNEDYQSMLLEGITSKMDNSIIPVIALYLELDLEEIFKDKEGKSNSFYVAYSELAQLFHKSIEKEVIKEVSFPFPPELENIDLDNLGDYDGEEPIPFQFVDTKPQFEGGGVENFQEWISNHLNIVSFTFFSTINSPASLPSVSWAGHDACPGPALSGRAERSLPELRCRRPGRCQAGSRRRA